jgi:hypothetical protein
MPEAREITVHFPLGGLDRTLAFQSQPPYTTPLCLNIWPTDIATGRGRGGVRPGLEGGAAVGGDPYGYCRISYLSSGAVKDGIAVCHANGTSGSLTGADWGTAGIPKITTPPATTLASCEAYNGYLFQARGGGTVRVMQMPSGSEGNLAVSFYDPGPDTMPKGTAPENCGIVIRHVDRLWLMGDTTNYHVVQASATGDHTNWDFADDTQGGAFINSGAEGGMVGDPITAAIRHNQTVLLVGGPTSITAFRGNPRVNGASLVSDTVGPLSNTAWCKGVDREGNDNTYFMSYDGLYMIPAGTLQVVKLSKRKIPNELLGKFPTLGADGNNTGWRTAIGFDNRWECIHISITNSSSTKTNYTYSISQDSYWPTAYADKLRLFPHFPTLQTETLSSVYPISDGGEGFQFDSAATEDFDSYMLLGPIMLGNGDSEGILHSITAALAKDSEDVNWRIYTGRTVQEAYERAAADTDPDFQGTKWTYSTTQYLNNKQHPRCRGYAAYVRIYDSANERWLLEDITARVSPAGIRRM